MGAVGREGTPAAMRHMAEQGRYAGSEAPFGSRLGEGGRLDAHEAEQAVIRGARLLRGRPPSSARPRQSRPGLRTGPGGPYCGRVSPKKAHKRDAKDLYALRLPDDLFGRVDAFARKLEKERPGMTVARADAVRAGCASQGEGAAHLGVLVGGRDPFGPSEHRERIQASSEGRRLLLAPFPPS
jgi:hypothetical protein